MSREEVRQELMLKALSRGDVSYALDMCRYLIKNFEHCIQSMLVTVLLLTTRGHNIIRYIGMLTYLHLHLFKSVKSHETSHDQLFLQVDNINRIRFFLKKRYEHKRVQEKNLED